VTVATPFLKMEESTSPPSPGSLLRILWSQQNYQYLLITCFLLLVLLVLVALFRKIRVLNLQNAVRGSLNNDSIAELHTLMFNVKKIMEETKPETKRVDYANGNYGLVTIHTPNLREDPPKAIFDLQIARIVEEMLDFNEKMMFFICILLNTCTGQVFAIAALLYLIMRVQQIRQGEIYDIKLLGDEEAVLKRKAIVRVCLLIVFLISTYSVVTGIMSSIISWILSLIGDKKIEVVFESVASMSAASIPFAITGRVYHEVYGLNDNNFVPLPFLLIPISTVAGFHSNLSSTCGEYDKAPFQYFIIVLIFLCLCSKKPTVRIAIFLTSIHAFWTLLFLHAYLTRAESKREDIRTQLRHLAINAFATVGSNLFFLWEYQQHFAFDNNELGGWLWQIVVSISLETNPNPRCTMREVEELIHRPNLKWNDIETLANKVSNKSGTWPRASELIIRILIMLVGFSLCLETYRVIMKTTAVEGWIIPNHHFQLLFISMVLIVIIWMVPSLKNDIVFNDYRFILRAFTFITMSAGITTQCIMNRGEPDPLFVGLAWLLEAAMWLFIVDEANATDFRILASMVSLVNGMTNAGSSPIATFHLHLVLFEFLDIRTQRLLTVGNKISIACLRALLLSILYFDHRTLADLIFAGLFSSSFVIVLGTEADITPSIRRKSRTELEEEIARLQQSSNTQTSSRIPVVLNPSPVSVCEQCEIIAANSELSICNSL
jgi:hypothetical protein